LVAVRAEADIANRSLVTDAVEKGKNEQIEVFARTPVETGLSQSNASQ
jgi:hypothetical protein